MVIVVFMIMFLFDYFVVVGLLVFSGFVFVLVFVYVLVVWLVLLVGLCWFLIFFVVVGVVVGMVSGILVWCLDDLFFIVVFGWVLISGGIELFVGIWVCCMGDFLVRDVIIVGVFGILFVVVLFLILVGFL